MTVYTARLTDGTSHLLSRDAAYGQVCIRCGCIPDGSERAGVVTLPSPHLAVGNPVIHCWPACPDVAQATRRPWIPRPRLGSLARRSDMTASSG